MKLCIEIIAQGGQRAKGKYFLLIAVNPRILSLMGILETILKEDAEVVRIHKASLSIKV